MKPARSGGTMISTCFPCFFTAEELKLQAAASAKKRNRPELRYHVNWSHFKLTKPDLMRQRFVQSYCDSGTQQWLRETERPSRWRQFASDLLCKAVGRTSANGLTFRGGMFVFSKAQVARLFKCTERGVSEADQRFPAGVAPLPSSSDCNAAAAVGDGAPRAVLNRYGLAPSGAAAAAAAASATSKHSDNDDDDDDADRAGSNRKNHDDTAVDASEELRRILGQADADDGGSAAMRHREHSHRTSKTTGAAPTAAAAAAASSKSPAVLAREAEDALVKEYLLKYKVVVDIGAGDGGVTQHLAAFFTDVVVTEDNTVMRLRLKHQFGSGNVIDSEQTSALLLCVPPQADVVALLNVIDRCERPITLLREIRQGLINRMWLRDMDPSAQSQPAAALPPLLLLAVVLPWCPFVETGAQQMAPAERLAMEGGTCREGASFEQSLDRLVHSVLEPLGFRLRCWTRLPYLSEGDAENAYFCLDDAVLCLEPVPLPAEQQQSKQ